MFYNGLLCYGYKVQQTMIEFDNRTSNDCPLKFLQISCTTMIQSPIRVDSHTNTWQICTTLDMFDAITYTLCLVCIISIQSNEGLYSTMYWCDVPQHFDELHVDDVAFAVVTKSVLLIVTIKMFNATHWTLKIDWIQYCYNARSFLSLVNSTKRVLCCLHSQSTK